MNHKIRAVFFDVDGTIYAHDIHDVPVSTREALWKLHEAGYKICLATSRCQYEFRQVPAFLKTFPFDGRIFDGGALILKDNELYDHRPVLPNDTKTILDYAKKHNLEVRYSTTNEDYFTTPVDTKIMDVYFNLYLNVPRVKPYEKERVLNFLVYTKTLEQKKELMSLLEDATMSDHGDVIEVTGPRTGKAIAVEDLAKCWNIPMDEVMCFGDGANDIVMLKKAGVGIAMGNGHPLAKENADYVCDHILQDGLAKILKEFKMI